MLKIFKEILQKYSRGAKPARQGGSNIGEDLTRQKYLDEYSTNISRNYSTIYSDICSKSIQRNIPNYVEKYTENIINLKKKIPSKGSHHVRKTVKKGENVRFG